MASAASSLISTSLQPARVLEEQRNLYTVALEQGDFHAQLCGKLRHECHDRSQLPCVGDFVTVDAPRAGSRTVIRSVLPRRSLLDRKGAGRSMERQCIAANVDTVLVAMAAAADFSLRRLERYLALVYEAGAMPAVLLTKADLCPDPEPLLQSVQLAALGVPVIALSAHSGHGMLEFAALLTPGTTLVLVGSSGVGKSTLVNYLLGSRVQEVREIRAGDQRGTHTTTARSLWVLPSGALLIDTPGMRELAAADEEGLLGAFSDVEELGTGCRFRDCRHDTEPGCAVRQATEEGTLDAERLGAWFKLKRESAFLARKDDVRARLAEQRRWKQQAKANRKRPRKGE